MAGQANFNEIIQLTVDVQGFAKSLAQAKAEYDKWLKNLGKESSDVISAGGFSSLTSQLEEALTVLTEIFQEQKNVAEAQSAIIDKLSAKSEAATKKKIESAKKQTEAEISELQKQTKAAEEELKKQNELRARFEEGLASSRRDKVKDGGTGFQTEFLKAAEERDRLDKERLATQEKFVELQRQSIPEELAAASERVVLEERRNVAVSTGEKLQNKAILSLAQSDQERLRILDQQLSTIQKQRAALQPDVDSAKSKNVKELSEDDVSTLNKSNQLLREEIDLLNKVIATRRKIYAESAREQAAQQKKFNEEQKRLDDQAKEEETRYKRELERAEALAEKQKFSQVRNNEEKVEKAHLSALKDQLEIEEKQLSLEERISQEVERSNKLRAQGEIAASRSDKERTAAIRDRLNLVRQERAALEERIGPRLSGASLGGQSKLTEEDLSTLRRINQLRSEENSLLNRNVAVQNNLTQSSRTFFQGLVEGLPRTISLLLRYYGAWVAIQAAIDATIALIAGPFLAAANGIKFLETTEQQVNQLTGVIASTAKFSDDLAENFQISAKASAEVVKQLQQAAIATGKPTQLLLDSFKAVSEGGGLRLVDSLGDAVKLATTLQVLLSATGNGALASQISVQEIAKLFTGEITDSSNKYLQALGLTNAEWQKMVAQAKTHRDLLEQLQSRFQPYLDAVAQNEKSLQKLTERIRLLLDRITALGATNAFEKIRTALEYILKLLEKNGDLISSWIKLFTDGLVEILITIGSFISQSIELKVIWGIISGLFKAVAFYAVTMKNEFVIILETVRAIRSLAADGIFGKTEDVKKNFDRVSAAIESAKKSYAEYANLLFNESTVSSKSDGSDNILNQGFKPRPAPEVLESQISTVQKRFQTLRKDYEREIELIKNAYKSLTDSVKEKVAERLISEKDAQQQTVKLLEGEDALIKKVYGTVIESAKKLRAQIAGDPNAKGKQKTEALEQFDNDVRSLKDNANKAFVESNKQQLAARRAAAAEDLAITREQFKTRIKLVEQNTQAELALRTELARQGVLTDRELFEAEVESQRRLFANQREVLVDEVNRFPVGSVERKKAIDALVIADVAYTDAMQLLAQRRIQVIQDEQTKLTAFLAQRRSLILEQGALLADINNLIDPNNNVLAFQQALNKAKSEELEILIREKEEQLAIAAARNLESESTRRLTNEVTALKNERLRLLEQNLREIQQTVPNRVSARILSDRAVREEISTLQSRRTTLVREGGSEQAVQDVENTIKALEAVIENASPTMRKAIKTLADTLFGVGNIEAFKAARTNVDKLASASNIAATALANIGNIVSTFRQGQEQGGTLGGIGAVVGSLSPALEAIPVVGKFIPAIAGVLTFVGGLFTAAAKKIAADVKKQFSETIEAFQNGNVNLIDTLTELERQRQDAIIRLSGRKGGKEQLNDLLPEFDNEIQRLKKQQEQILSNFDASLNSLKLQSDVLSEVANKWQGINDQVKEYIGAGGDAAKAAEFLALNLANIQKDAQRQLDDAEEQAIQDAIQLNDLLQERNKIIDDYNKKQFDVITQGALERKKANSVIRGQELQDLAKQRDAQLEAIDTEIKALTNKVEKEREIFNLATDVAELRRRSDELTLKALDDQISKLKDLKAIAGGFIPGALGAGNVTTTYNIDVKVTPTPGLDPTSIGREIADSVAYELSVRARQSV